MEDRKNWERGGQDSGGFIPNQEKILGLIIVHNKGIKSLNPTEFSFNFIILSFNTIKLSKLVVFLTPEMSLALE